MGKNFFTEFADLKKYFAAQNAKARRITFYSERSIYYQYYEGLINYTLQNSDLEISYVTSDADDIAFKFESPRFRVFYAKWLLPFITTATDARFFIYTMPDLGNYHIKRAQNPNVEHVYVFHAVGSMHLGYNKGAFDYYDTIFSVGDFNTQEILKTEELYHLKSKKIVDVGYPYLEKVHSEKAVEIEANTILIAPSWYEGNIFASCIEPMIESLLVGGFKVIARPHPEIIIRTPHLVEKVRKKFANVENFVMETNLADNTSVKTSALLITDWSGIGVEYALGTERPVLFVNTPMIVRNKAYEEVGIEPFECFFRRDVGECLEVENINQTAELAKKLINEKDSYVQKIREYRDKHLYNWGCSAEIGGKYFIDSLNKD